MVPKSAVQIQNQTRSPLSAAPARILLMASASYQAVPMCVEVPSTAVGASGVGLGTGHTLREGQSSHGVLPGLWPPRQLPHRWRHLLVPSHSILGHAAET